MKMTTEEAFVKVLQMHGIEHAFGIIGSAFMPISDLFPKAGITFWDVAHETNGGLICDGYTRASGKMGMAIAQNGPGVTGFVTADQDGLLEPHAAAAGHPAGGQQDHRPGRLPGSRADGAVQADMVCYQEEVRDPSRIAEVSEPGDREGLARLGAGADQRAARLLDPGDRHRAAADRPDRAPAGGEPMPSPAAKLLSDAKFPVILNGAGVVLGDAIPATQAKLAERLDAPVCCNYQHNDAFPGSHIRCSLGPLGYNGSKAAMELIAKADVVLALGTRLNPFSTLPGYGIDYWPKDAAIIQVDINADRIGLTKKVTVGIQWVTRSWSRSRSWISFPRPCRRCRREDRKATIHQTKSAWLQELSGMDHEDDDPGTTWNERSPQARCRAHEPRVRPGGRSRPACRRTPSSRPTSATTAPSATPTRRSRKGRKYLAPGLFGPCGYGFPGDHRRQDRLPRIPRWWASPATAPSASR